MSSWSRLPSCPASSAESVAAQWQCWKCRPEMTVVFHYSYRSISACRANCCVSAEHKVTKEKPYGRKTNWKYYCEDVITLKLHFSRFHRKNRDFIFCFFFLFSWQRAKRGKKSTSENRHVLCREDHAEMRWMTYYSTVNRFFCHWKLTPATKIHPIPVVVSTQNVLDFYGDADEAAGHPANFSSILFLAERLWRGPVVARRLLRWLYQSQSSLKSITHTHQRLPCTAIVTEPSGPPHTVYIYLYELYVALCACLYAFSVHRRCKIRGRRKKKKTKQGTAF